MTKYINSIGAGAIIAAVASASVGCDYRELCYDHPHGANVPVILDWEQCGECPDLKKVYMDCIRLTERDIIGYDLDSPRGGSVRLFTGEWKALARNANPAVTLSYKQMEGRSNDPDMVASSRTSTLADETQIFTKAEMPKAAGAESQRVALQPDPLWAGNSDVYRLNDAGPDTLWVNMYKRTCTVHIEIENVANLGFAGAFGASLSGLAGGIHLVSGHQTDEAVIMAMPLDKSGDKSLNGTLVCFGHSPGAEDGMEPEHILTVYALLGDGTKWYSSMNVTAQVESYPVDAQDIWIRIDSLPLPKPIINGSGFQPEVEGWTSVTIEISM